MGKKREAHVINNSFYRILYYIIMMYKSIT